MCYVFSARCTTEATGHNRYIPVWFSKNVLLLLVLLAVCSCVVADSRRGKNHRTMNVQRAGEVSRLLKNIKQVRGFHASTRLNKAERNPLKIRARSAKLIA